MRCLVTGGCGFVGRHLIARLLSDGHDVTCVDPIVPLGGGISPSRWRIIDPLDFQGFHYDALDCREWFSTHADEMFDVAFHLAAVVGGREVIERNPLAVAQDLAIDADFWFWATRARPARIVAFSSSAAYPIRFQRRKDYRLLKEDMIAFDGAHDVGLPDMTYGWSKLTTEFLARMASRRHGLKTICFRPFSGYGEDQDIHYPFPAILNRALERRGQFELAVWGSGLQMRDFIHIDDCIRGILILMNCVDDGSGVNLSTGIYTSMADLARMAARQLDWDPVIKGMSTRPEGVFARGGDTGIQKKMGFESIIGLEEGIGRGLHYLQKHK